MTSAATPTVEPLDATFGAVVTGVRLADIDGAGFARVHQLWLEHALLVFPGQHLTNAEQVAFARRFGELEFDLAPITNVRRDGTVRLDDPGDDVVKILKGNMGWHQDSTYMPVQAKGAVFTAHVVPSEGGQTGWADMRAAYDTLDPDRRALLETRAAYHSLYYSQTRAGFGPSADGTHKGYGFFGQDPPLRPLVKTHPETGRRSLAIGRHAYGIVGMDPEASEHLLDELIDWACQPPRVYHHRWSPGDAVIWDNRCLLHRACPWDMRQPRVMYHARIAGDPKSEFAAHA